MNTRESELQQEILELRALLYELLTHPLSMLQAKWRGRVKEMLAREHKEL